MYVRVPGVGIKGGDVPLRVWLESPIRPIGRARGITKCTGEMHPPQLHGSVAPDVPLNRDVCAFDFRFVTESALDGPSPSTTYYRDLLASTLPRPGNITENALL